LRKYVFQVEYGGLGDHLFYSPLPRLLKEYGMADRVYLSSQSTFRGPETYKVVWQANPYLDGISDDPPVHSPQPKSRVNKAVNIAMASHGIDLPDEISPELYLPKICSKAYANKHFIDLNYTSYVGAFTLFDAMEILDQHPDYLLVNPSKHLLRFCKNDWIRTKSLEDYASLINSSLSFTALASGGATLALALGRPSTVYYGFGQNQIFHHSKNTNLMIGGSGLFRKFLARYLSKRNAWRISQSTNR
jgi:hypothetical protein